MCKKQSRLMHFTLYIWLSLNAATNVNISRLRHLTKELFLIYLRFLLNMWRNFRRSPSGDDSRFHRIGKFSSKNVELTSSWRQIPGNQFSENRILASRFVNLEPIKYKTGTVWPDVEIKRSPQISKSCPKSNSRSYY